MTPIITYLSFAILLAHQLLLGRRMRRIEKRGRVIYKDILFFHIKLEQMQVDIQALVANEATLAGLVGQVVTTLQGYQQQLQDGIDNDDKTAIQGVNTKLTADITTLQTALNAINGTPAAPPADGSGDTGTDTAASN